ncbi:SAM domain-containing protein [Chytriomyces sp. MP71]|nr:SAM domain-containing protein [Chytriomyces sp. MP71]
MSAPHTSSQFWDERYAATDVLVYGEAPNDHVVAACEYLKANSKVISLGEGEGRNAVFLATRGHAVHCVDLSPVGLTKAQKLAEAKGVSSLISTQAADLSDCVFGVEQYDAVVAIWCHLPSALRRSVHERAVHSLKPGGIVLLEAYTPANIGRGTGGPGAADFCMSEEILRAEFGDSVEWKLMREVEREVKEGSYHTGLSATVQAIAVKK